MIASSNYQKLGSIRSFFTQLNTLPNTIIILGGGNGYQADSFIKELSLELDFEYKEFNPYHTPHSQYSALPRYRYGKQFSTKNFAIRYQDLIKQCDKLIVFQDQAQSDTFINQVCKRIEKGNFPRPAVIITD